MRKFTESVQNEISFDRIDDLGRELNDIESYIDLKLKDINDIMMELSKYRSKSTKQYDQIDECITTLQTLKSDLQTSVNNLDIVQTNLTDYKENGRRKV